GCASRLAPARDSAWRAERNAVPAATSRDVLLFTRRRHPRGGCSEVREPGVRRNNLGPFIVHETRPRPSLHTGRLCIRRAALDVVHVAPSASCPITNPRPPARCALALHIVSFRRAGSFGHAASDARESHRFGSPRHAGST